jgi:hypothetical protein
MKYYGVKVDEDKMNQLGFEKPTCAEDSTHLLTFAESPKDLLFDPVKLFNFYIDHCHPDAISSMPELVQTSRSQDGQKSLQDQFGLGRLFQNLLDSSSVSPRSPRTSKNLHQNVDVKDGRI